jgi:DNA-binding transcriptional LysR family regulator
MIVINLMNDSLDFGQLVAFEKAARHGSFTRAARELGLSQPALSHRIHLLEASLGRPVFTRQHRGVRLTADGEILYDAVAPSLARIREAVDRVRRRDANPRLRIALDFALGGLWLMPRLTRTGLDADGIDLQIVSGHHSPARQMRDGDIAFVLADPATLPGHAIRLFREAVVPVCSPRFLEAHPVVSDPQRLLELPLIHNETPADDTWLTWPDWAAQNDLPWMPGGSQATFSTYPLVLQATLAGRGVALGWLGLVDDLLGSGQLVAPVKAGARSHRWYCAVRSGDTPGPAARAFLDAIERLAQAAHGA